MGPRTRGISGISQKVEVVCIVTEGPFLKGSWCTNGAEGESYPSTSSDSEIEKLELHPEGLYSDSFSFLRLKHEHMFHLKTV